MRITERSDEPRGHDMKPGKRRAKEKMGGEEERTRKEVKVQDTGLEPWPDTKRGPERSGQKEKS